MRDALGAIESLLMWVENLARAVYVAINVPRNTPFD